VPGGECHCGGRHPGELSRPARDRAVPGDREHHVLRRPAQRVPGRLGGLPERAGRPAAADPRPRLSSALGGISGALLLLVTPGDAFAVPFLIFISCALLAAQPRLARAVAARRSSDTGGGGGTGWLVRAGVLVSAVYGSYFGAGLGVLLLAVLGILVHDQMQRLNAFKGLLSLGINLVGVTVFVVSGEVAWFAAALLTVAAYVGGLLGVRVARVLPARVLRFAVVALGAVVGTVLLVAH